MTIAESHGGMKLCRMLIFSIVIAVSFIGADNAYADSFNAFGDFSGVSNPNGVWTYGFTSTLGGTLTLFDTSVTGVLGFPSSLVGWQSPSVSSALGIYANTAGTNINNFSIGGTAVIPPAFLMFHPGPQGQQAVLQWTAQSAGVWNVAGLFQGLDFQPGVSPPGTSTDVHVLVNGLSVFDSTVIGFGATQPFNLNLTLAAGDNVSFAVGFGPNNFFGADTTGLQAGITKTTTPVPEPCTLILLGTGVVGIGLRRRRG